MDSWSRLNNKLWNDWKLDTQMVSDRTLAENKRIDLLAESGEPYYIYNFYLHDGKEVSFAFPCKYEWKRSELLDTYERFYNELESKPTFNDMSDVYNNVWIATRFIVFATIEYFNIKVID